MVGHISVMCPSMEAIVVGTIARFVALTMVTTCYVVDSLEAQGQERSKGLKFIVYIYNIYKYDATQNLDILLISQDHFMILFQILYCFFFAL